MIQIIFCCLLMDELLRAVYCAAIRENWILWVWEGRMCHFNQSDSLFLP